MATVWCIGCGDLGTGIGAALIQQGQRQQSQKTQEDWQVIGIRRQPPAQPPFTQVAVDVLADPDALRALPPPDYVVYTVTPSERSEAAYTATYDQGVRQLLQVLPGTVRRFILVSSTGIYHQHQGEWLDETSPVAPTSFSGKALLAGEQHVLQSAIPAAVVRLSGIYGPGRHRLIERARKGAAAIKHPPAWTNRIHRDDAVGFIVHLLLQCHAGAALHCLYLATDDVPATEWDVMCDIHHQLGLPAPLEAAGSEDQNKRLRNTRLHESGYQLRYPGYHEGYADMIRRLNDAT